MKKIISVIAVMVLTVFFTLSIYLAFSIIPVRAQTNDEIDDINFAKDFLNQFVTDYPDRGSDSPGEYAASEFLLTTLHSYGLSVDEQPILLDGIVRSRNIIASIDTPNTDNKIVIGAHYDALYAGAQDNATGVTALIMIAEQLAASRAKLTCDIDLVAFGSEEKGLVGSQYYVSRLSQSNMSKIKLMINIDSIGGGDNLYLFGENKKTNFIEILLTNATDVGNAEILQKPLNKGLMYGVDMYGFGYYQIAQNSDHTPFRLNGIPTAFYFSGTYDTFGGAYQESLDNNKCVMNTNQDTLSSLTHDGTSSLYAERIVCVVDSICLTLSDEQDTAILFDARQELVSDIWYQALYPKIAVIVMLVVAVIVFVSYMKKLQKQAILGVAYNKHTTRVFSKPNADDIFDLGDKK